MLFQLMDGIANAVSDSCVPQIIPDIEPQTADGKTVILRTLLNCLKCIIYEDCYSLYSIVCGGNGIKK